VLKLLAFTFTFALANPAPQGAEDPHAPTPPAAPTAPKVEGPTAPTAPKKEEKKAEKSDKKDDKAAATKPAEGAKGGEASKPGPEKATGEKATAEKGAAKKPARPRDRGTPTPPSLTGTAMRQEMKQSTSEAAVPAPVSERARLEALAADITKAREALKQDTARLETMLRSGGAGEPARMPLGDQMGAPPVPPPGEAASREAMKEQILTVSKAMKGMKPEQAAAIIARLDRVLASEILRRMKAADAGAVMASIKPELAADLATTIATRRSIVDGDLKKDLKK
jgi:flagellar motility protein MotE (MotC chaperone)